jgi:hypothetical protein
VLFACVTPAWAAEFLPVWEPFDTFLPGTPVVVPSEELVVDFALPDDLLAVKVQAINAHVSQVEAIVAAVGEETWWRQMAWEGFRLGDEREHGDDG